MIKRLLYISLLFILSCAKGELPESNYSFNFDKEYLLSVTGCPNGSGCNGWVGISFPKLKQQSIQGREAIVGSLPDGTKVTISASPAEGYYFDKWSNGWTANPTTFKLNSETIVTAVFKTIAD